MLRVYYFIAPVSSEHSSWHTKRLLHTSHPYVSTKHVLLVCEKEKYCRFLCFFNFSL